MCSKWIQPNEITNELMYVSYVYSFPIPIMYQIQSMSLYSPFIHDRFNVWLWILYESILIQSNWSSSSPSPRLEPRACPGSPAGVPVVTGTIHDSPALKHCYKTNYKVVKSQAPGPKSISLKTGPLQFVCTLGSHLQGWERPPNYAALMDNVWH